MSALLSRRLAGTLDTPEVPATPRNVASLDAQLAEVMRERDSLRERLEALADERAGNDVARTMLRERFEEIEALRTQVGQLTLERDALKQAVDDLTAPPKKPRREG